MTEDLLGKKTMPWEERDDDQESEFYSNCVVCGKHIHNWEGRMPYIEVWGFSLNSEDFCVKKCARKHFKDTGVKRKCLHCKCTFYAPDTSVGRSSRFCCDPCRDSFNSDRDAPFDL